MIQLPRPFKAGDTFRLPFSVTDPNGGAINIGTWTIRSQMRDTTGNLIQEFTITLENLGAGGRALVGASAAETASWLEGFYIMDIEVTDDNGEVYSTVDIQVQVVEGQTRV